MSVITYAFPKKKKVEVSCYADAYALVLECSQSHSPKAFAIKFLHQVSEICPYDKASALFVDEKGGIIDDYSVNRDSQWTEIYLDYYVKLTDYPEYIHPNQSKRESSNFVSNKIIDWRNFPRSEFIDDFIGGLGLIYTWGFAFFDVNGFYRVMFSLDRTRDVPFSKRERDTLGLALPILNNLFRNYFYTQNTQKNIEQEKLWERYHFTPKETEIVKMLLRGFQVKNISETLYIAKTTTYKHLTHIYHKVGVSSKHELLVRLLNEDIL